MTSWDRLWHKTISHILFKSVLRQIEMKNVVENKNSFGRRIAMEIYHIGEELRQELQSANLIKDRKYHLRTYKSCFVGKDIIDWLVKCKHCENREKAIDGLRILQQYSFFHHVCDDHEIKDEVLFYRFRRDDDTYKETKDLLLFYKAQELYDRLSTRKVGLMKSYQQNGELYRNAFQGSVFVDNLIKEGSFYSREDAMLFGRRLLENDTIKHVSDDYHFRDDSRLLYQFTIEFTKQRVLSDIFHFVPRSHGDKQSRLQRSTSYTEKEQVIFHTPISTPDVKRKQRTSSGSLTTSSHSSHEGSPRTHDSGLCNHNNGRSNHDHGRSNHDHGHCNHDHGHCNPDDEEDRCRSLSADSGTSSDTSAEHGTTKSVLIRHATAEELESPDTPYIRTSIKIRSDPVGYGFVIRGENPAYVQAVDPMGPASVAGLKVRQYIHSVNGQYVLRSDHKTVGKLIMRNSSSLNLVIMTHKRDAAM